MSDRYMIRRAGEADAHGIFLVSEASIEGAERWSERLFREDLKDPEKLYFIAEDFRNEDRIVGFVGAAHILDEAHIMDIAVLPNCRREGVGSELLNTLFEISCEKGIRAFTLEARVGNAAAKALYKRCGFVSAGIRKSYYPDKEDAEIYWKE